MSGRKLKPEGTPYLALIDRIDGGNEVVCFVGHWVLHNNKKIDIREHKFNHWVDAEIFLREIGCKKAIFYSDLREERRGAKEAIKIVDKTRGTLFEADFFEELSKELNLPEETDEEDFFTKELYDNY